MPRNTVPARTGLQLLLAALLLGAGGGCSHEQVYNAAQERGRQDCAKLPQQQYEDCMRDYEQSYDEYESERRKVVEDGGQ